MSGEYPAFHRIFWKKCCDLSLGLGETGQRFGDTIKFEFFVMHASIDRMGLRDLAEYFHLNDDIYGQSPTGFKDYLTAFFYRPFLEWAFASLLGYDLRLFQAF